jgi:cytochrome d ubiquinol oxidase subunit I
LRTTESIAPVGAVAVGSSLVVFVVVYLAVFGAGTYYALYLMSRSPEAGKIGEDWLTRSAGITPGLAMGRGRGKSAREEDRHGN